GEIAVQGQDAESGWYLYHLGNTRKWGRLQLGDAIERIQSLVSFDSHRGLGLQGALRSRPHDERSDWQWFYRDVQGGWVELHKLVPDLPLRIRAIESYASGRLLVIEEIPSADTQSNSGWHYFWHKEDGTWV